MNCLHCGGFMKVVEERGPLAFPPGRTFSIESREESMTIVAYRECTRCGQCVPMDETQPPYAEMRGPPQ